MLPDRAFGKQQQCESPRREAKGGRGLSPRSLEACLSAEFMHMPCVRTHHLCLLETVHRVRGQGLLMLFLASLGSERVVSRYMACCPAVRIGVCVHE